MIGWIILGLVAAFLALLLIRAALFNPKNKPLPEAKEVSFNKEAAISALQQLVQCKTISFNDKALEDDAEFQKLTSAFLSLAKKAGLLCQEERVLP